MTFIGTVVMPIALAIIMLGLGLSLTVADFRRILEQPRAVVVALVCQTGVMPVVCLAIVLALKLPPEFAVGMMLLAASPGGTVANLFSHLSNGDVALNVTLTAVNSFLSLLTLPLIVNLSLAYFMDGTGTVPLVFTKIIQVFAIVLVPVTIGMLVRNRKPVIATALHKPVKVMSAVILLGLVVMVLVTTGGKMVARMGDAGLACVLFSVLSLAAGYGSARLARLPERQSIAIGMEIGVHNAALAIGIGISPLMLNNPSIAIPPTIYGLVMLVTATGFGFLVSRRGKVLPEPARSPASS